VSYKQIRSFNQSTAGSKAGYCLQNVRTGFQISAKYDDAWEAWNGTEQHPNRDIPGGVDVPLFYDYTDSKKNRYGHINVRLANGKVWNDGKVYSNLNALEKALSNVKYVGWGESVNGVRVIEEETDMAVDISLEIGRILYAMAGYDGVRFKENALKGDLDKEIERATKGQKLDGNYIRSLYNSPVWKDGQKTLAGLNAEAQARRAESSGSQYEEVKEKLYRRK